MAAAFNRRWFLSLPGLAAIRALAQSNNVVGSKTIARQRKALQIRQDAAVLQSLRAVADHATNGDETTLPGYIASFTKGLSHTQTGEVASDAYESLLNALSSGKQSDFENIARGSGVKLVNPQAAFAFQLEGSDSHRFGTPLPPAFSSAETAAEMVELYWQALARDVPFTHYDTSSVTRAAAEDINRLSDYRGPVTAGKVTLNTLFRGEVPGGLIGPYISQFFWKPVPVNSTLVDQRYRVPTSGVDYLTSYPEWLMLQTGVPPYREWTCDPIPRYLHTGRALAEWVHYDFLHQAFHNAALILLNQGPDTVLNTNPYLAPTNPYKRTVIQTGFGTFGAPHICCLLARACESALQAAWFQKWLVHRRLRPEAFGARVHQTKLAAANYPVHPEILGSAALEAVFAKNKTYLLPQAYSEGCPLHPAYPAGHASVAGACSVVLKAFFDEAGLMTDCVVANSDGLSLEPYTGVALSVGGEINKLAFNVAMGRNFAGIHYRSDAMAGFALGEEVAIAMLEDVVTTLTEDFEGFHFTRLDGRSVRIKNQTNLTKSTSH